MTHAVQNHNWDSFAIAQAHAARCRSTGKVANLTIQATLSNCILHRRGRVTVEACKLQCHAGGLEHLFTPLVTLAAADLRKHKQPRSARTGIEAGMGVLSVIETKIRVSKTNKGCSDSCLLRQYMCFDRYWLCAYLVIHGLPADQCMPGRQL